MIHGPQVAAGPSTEQRLRMTKPSTIASDTAGFWRRILLTPSPGSVLAGLEDDFHRFTMQLDHHKGIVTGLYTTIERYPWSTCVDAGEYLAGQINGKALEDIATLDPRIHCTHLFELAILCAAHANDARPLLIDLFVADRRGDKTTATLSENGISVLHWELKGTVIESPADWAGRDLRKLSSWKQSLAARQSLWAMLLRRAAHISHGRQLPALFPVQRAVDRGPERMGACFTYQLPRAENAVQSKFMRRDFSQTDEDPLQGYHPVKIVSTGAQQT